jgi:uncharacterized phage protein (TIGR01671 family)
MREIKFRLWDNGLPVMIHDASINWYNGKQYVDWDEGTCELAASDMADQGVFLMQYTGLKDKNGAEIYEGDIIMVCNWGGSGEELGITSVVWDIYGNGWRYASGSRDLAEEDCDEFRNVEVIGNIHENPELLESEKQVISEEQGC